MTSKKVNTRHRYKYEDQEVPIPALTPKVYVNHEPKPLRLSA